MSVEDSIRSTFEQLVHQMDDPEAVIAEVERRAERHRHRRNVARALVAAALVTVVGVGVIAVSVTNRSSDAAKVMAGGPDGRSSTTLGVPPPGEVRADQLADGSPVWVVHHADDTVSVLDAVSAHNPFGVGQIVAWCGQARGFVDPKYGTGYDERERVRGGPAPTGLGSYPTAPVVGARIAITGAERAQPRSQDGGEESTPATGPACTSYADGTTGSGPATLVRHAAAGWPSTTLGRAMRAREGEMVVVRDAAIVVSAQGGIVCPSKGDFGKSQPPTCNGVKAPELSLMVGADSHWAVITGTFIARVEDHALRDIAYVDESTRTVLGP